MPTRYGSGSGVAGRRVTNAEPSWTKESARPVSIDETSASVGLALAASASTAVPLGENDILSASWLTDIVNPRSPRCRSALGVLSQRKTCIRTCEGFAHDIAAFRPDDGCTAARFIAVVPRFTPFRRH